MRVPLTMPLLGLILAACMSDPYAPVNASIDPADISAKSPDNRYTVTYRGSPDASVTDVYDLALLRASTITLQKGGDWFEIVSEYSRTDRRPDSAFQEDPFARRVQQTANCGVLGCTTSAQPEAGSSDIEALQERRAFVTQSFEIVVHEGAVPVGTANAYDAVETSDRVRAKYVPDP